jgi:hypothetical protein
MRLSNERRLCVVLQVSLFVLFGCSACVRKAELDNGFIQELAKASASQRSAMVDRLKNKPIQVSGTVSFISGAQTTNLHLDIPELAGSGPKMDVGVNLLTSQFDTMTVEGDTMSIEGGKSAVVTVRYPGGKTRSIKRGDRVVARGRVGYMGADDLIWVAGATLE